MEECKIMNEKELFIETIEEADFIAIFSLLGENQKMKNSGYKKQKLKKMLTTSLTMRTGQSAWDVLKEKFCFEGFKDLTPNELLKVFVMTEPYVPMSIRFFTLKAYHPEFFEEKMPMMIENVKNNKYFLSDLIEFKDSEEAETCLAKVTKAVSGDGLLDYLIEDMYDWLKHMHPEALAERVKLVENQPIEVIDRLCGSNQDIDLDYFMTSVALMKYGDISFETQNLLYQLIHHHYTTHLKEWTKESFHQFDEKLKNDRQQHQQKTKELKKDLKQLEQQLKKKEVELKRVEKDSLSTSTKALDETRSLKVKYEKENHLLKKEVEELSAIVEKNRQLAEFFKRGIQTPYHDLNYVICHNFPLIYIQELFPEFTFVSLEDFKTFNLTSDMVLWIQSEGISYKEKCLIVDEAYRKNLAVREFLATDERGLIMELSYELKVNVQTA